MEKEEGRSDKETIGYRRHAAETVAAISVARRVHERCDNERKNTKNKESEERRRGK